MDEKVDTYSDFIEGLDEKQTEAINGFLELVGGKAEIEHAMLLGEQMIHNDDNKSQISEDSVNSIMGYLGEYMRGFLVMGYDMNGGRVVISNAKTAQDVDSLMSFSHSIPQLIVDMDRNNHDDGDLDIDDFFDDL